jgi:hypothetical protein
MNKFHDVQQIEFDDTNLILSADGQEYRLPLSAVSNKLARGSDAERRIYQISPSGYGVRWPVIDEDLSIDGLLKLAARAPI